MIQEIVLQIIADQKEAYMGNHGTQDKSSGVVEEVAEQRDVDG
jgi:hypothetical protein